MKFNVALITVLILCGTLVAGPYSGSTTGSPGGVIVQVNGDVSEGSSNCSVDVADNNASTTSYSATAFETPPGGEDPVEQNTSHHVATDQDPNAIGAQLDLEGIEGLMCRGAHRVMSGQLDAWEIVIVGSFVDTLLNDTVTFKFEISLTRTMEGDPPVATLKKTFTAL